MSGTRVALVTGSNKGIGFEIVRGLAKKGLTVLLCARDTGKADAAVRKLREDSASYQIFPLVLDVTKQDTIDAAAEYVRSRFGKLDVLVNNAAIYAAADGLPGVAKVDAVIETFETNFFGVIGVTQAFLPLIKASPSARIVNVSSGLGSLALNADPTSPFAAVKPLGYNGS